MMAPSTEFDKANWQKKLLNDIKAFQQCITSGPESQKGAAKQQTPGVNEIGAVTQLVKSLLSEPSNVGGKALGILCKEQVLQASIAWLARFTPTKWTDPACTTAATALGAVTRLIKLQLALIRSLNSPHQLAGLPASSGPQQLAASQVDPAPLEAALNRLLSPLLSPPPGPPTPTTYHTLVLGSALNTLTALGTLALHPALASSPLSTSLLACVCTTSWVPAMAAMLAHGHPAPAPGQPESAWYEGCVGAVVRLLAAARDGPTATDAACGQGWARQVQNPAVQELLLERLIHGLTEASPSGTDRPPGFASFGLLPGRCVPDDDPPALLRCLDLSLDAQWRAWRAAQQARPQARMRHPGGVGAGGEPLGGALEAPQLFDLTRQVGEQAVSMFSVSLQDYQDAVEDYEDEVAATKGAGRPPSPPQLPPGEALGVVATCLGQLQWLWPGLGPQVWHRQLPLLIALAANALAFAVQLLEAGAGEGGGHPGSPPAQPHRHHHHHNQPQQGGHQGPRPVFGRGAGQAPGSGATPQAPAAGGGTALDARECFTRAASVMAFLFPLDRSAPQLASDPRLYPQQDWPQVAVQAAGAAGAVELALRSATVPSPAVRVLLLHATAGIGLAAPPSFWLQATSTVPSHSASAEAGEDTGAPLTAAAGLLPTFRKAANAAAAALERNLEQAEEGGRDILAAAAAGGGVYVAAGAVPPPHAAAGQQAVAAATAAAAVAAAVEVPLQQHADLLYRLLAMVMDSFMVRTAPQTVHGGNKGDGDNHGVDHPAYDVSASQPQLPPWLLQAHLKPQPVGKQVQSDAGASIVVLMGTQDTTPAPSPTKSNSNLVHHKRGVGQHNPHAVPAPDAPRYERVSEASLTMRAYVLAQLGPPWLRLLGAQLAAAMPAVEASLRASAAATHAVSRAPDTRAAAKRAQALDAASGRGDAEAWRYKLMRAGLEWVVKQVEGCGALAGAVLSAASAAAQRAAAGPAGRSAPMDPELFAVAKASRELVGVVQALEVVPLLRGLVATELRRLGSMGVAEGQAGAMRTVTRTLVALAGLPGNGKAMLARRTMQDGLLMELGSLFDAQRAGGGRAAAASATMDSLQVICGAAAAGLRARPGGKTMADSVDEISKMMSYLASPSASTNVLPSEHAPDTDANTLAEVMVSETDYALAAVAGPMPSMDSVLSSMVRHVGCCYPHCTNLSDQSEALMRLHLCQGCMRVRYCSRECQVAAWGRHAEQCEQWSKLVRPS